MIHRIGEKIPETEKAAFIAWNAEVAGAVILDEDSSVWFGASVRGDIASVFVGSGSNIQDNATVHVDTDVPVTVGRNVTVGHNAVIHGCTIGDGSLVGMGAIILSRAVIGKECLVGAGALVTEGKHFPDRSLIVGSPARVVRELSGEDIEKMKHNAESYVKHAYEAACEYREVLP